MYQLFSLLEDLSLFWESGRNLWWRRGALTRECFPRVPLVPVCKGCRFCLLISIYLSYVLWGTPLAALTWIPSPWWAEWTMWGHCCGCTKGYGQVSGIDDSGIDDSAWWRGWLAYATFVLNLPGMLYLNGNMHTWGGIRNIPVCIEPVIF